MQISSLRVLVGEEVGKGVHVVRGWEGVIPVGEDVGHREGDVLAAPPEHLAEEMVGVEGVGEVDVEATPSHADLLDAEHRWSARWEVCEARPEEEPGKVQRPPPVRDGPDPQGILHEHPSWVLPLGDDGRTTVGRTVELQGVGLGR